MARGEKWRIVGFGLAGVCLAWRLHERGEVFEWCDTERPEAASRVAAGLINPVTGKNFEPSWRLGEFLPEAVSFFRHIEETTGEEFWHPLPIHRWVSAKDWKKVEGKLERPEVAEWVERVDGGQGDWHAVVVLKGGGRLNVRRFCEASARFFAERRRESLTPGRVLRCEGATGLMSGQWGEHRCAKGEILTGEIPGWDEGKIEIGGGGWLIPIGGGCFKAGATYEWEELDGRPTRDGAEKVMAILRRLGVEHFVLQQHEAGVRPIVRRSMPLIGVLENGEVGFNGLGSKGSLYAPGVSRRLVDWLVDGGAIEESLDVGLWRKSHA
ncbi:MAG: NAD(P)/FAD-dependent oxidoreductase [Verrucomicrobiales bacterium]